MFSYLRSAGRRSSSQTNVAAAPIQEIRTYDGSNTSSTNPRGVRSSKIVHLDADSRWSSFVSSGPPVLPPIPRIASQRRAHETLSQDGEGAETRLGSLQEPDHLFRSGRVAETATDASFDLAKELPTDTGKDLHRLDLNDERDCLGMSAPPRPAFYVPDPSLSHTVPSSQEPSPITSHAPRSQGSSSSHDEDGHYMVNELQSLAIPTTTTTTLRNEAQPEAKKSPRPKSRLNRLNPMVLLARRRSSQTVPETAESAYGSKLSRQEDYDPRIKGKVVHDFSAPRSIHNGSTQAPRFTQPRKGRGTSTSGQESQLRLEGISYPHDSSVDAQSKIAEEPHKPVFKEHFGDDIDTWRLNPDDRRNQSTIGILDRMSTQGSNHQRLPLPAFARNFPEDVPTPMLPTAVPPYPSPQPLLDVAMEKTNPQSDDPMSTRQGSPKSRSCTALDADLSFQPGNLPIRFKSNSSRFSFDLAGVGSSAQEKLLEDRHRQRNVQRTRSSALSAISMQEEEEAYDDDNGMDYDDDFEEEIPGMRSDDYDFGVPGTLSGLTLSTAVQDVVLSTNGDLEYGSSKSPAIISNHRVQLSSPSPKSHISEEETSGSNQNHSVYNVDQSDVMERGSGPLPDQADDDLYFDDGLIEDLDVQDQHPFDEGVFDDETSRIYGIPLRDLKPLPTTSEPSQQSTRPTSVESTMIVDKSLTGFTDDTSRTSVQPKGAAPTARKPSLAASPRLEISADLTQENLAAYHNALACAANQAALDGRFEHVEIANESGQQCHTSMQFQRHVSFDEPQAPSLALEPSAPRSDGEASQPDFDDIQEDDAIIAAANAEALENDDDGFYGQEFGFYAHSNGSSKAEYSNGGYFGPADMNKVKRSHSGRVDFQEPSLTPITERSEWSQRNSMISLAMQGSAFAMPLQPSSLVPLADARHFDEDNMTLSALMALRRGAWGGSSTSVNSLPGGKGGSPGGYGMPLQSSSPLAPNLCSNSPTLFISEDPCSPLPPLHFPMAPSAVPLLKNPLLTLQTHNLMIGPYSQPDTAGSASSTSPLKRSGPKGHSRNSSGAESVSYAMEKNEDGGSVWVVEKRRMAEGGQMEVFGREVVEGKL